MASLSVVLIVKNEQETIEACLDSIESIADEIIVLDSGSDDNTVALCEQKGAKVYVNKVWPGFGKQRQIAQSYATKDWVFMLDADEHFTEQSRAEIRAMVDEDNQNYIWQIPRLSKVFGRFIKHSGWYPDYVMRLYPREKVNYNDSLVHEKLQLNGELHVGNLKHHILHFTYKDMNDYLIKSANYANAWATQRHEQGKTTSIANALLHGVVCFIKMYIIRAGFLDGKQGFILALLSAHSTFVKYIDLWVKNNQG
jgi:(heptosyl)LPS beta-1,4-glucosyltransferase